jgi:Tfp pilus assembly protein FimT
MVVVALSSILLATGVVMFSALYKSQRQFSLRERQRRELSRLDAILRSDTHAASTATVDDNAACELKNGQGETWSYRRDENDLLRLRSRDGKLVQRESFRLQPGTKVEFVTNREGERIWLNVRLQPPEAAAPAIAPATPFDGKFLIGGLVPRVFSASTQGAKESP